MVALLRRGQQLLVSIERVGMPLAALLTRVVLGHAFVLTGLGKWRNFDRTVEFFASIGVPAAAANAAFVSTLEIAGGIGLVLGLGTRLFAALLSSTMVVALLTADRSSFVGALTGSGEQGLTDVAAFVFLLFLAWLFACGAGAFSADRLVARRLQPAPG